MQGKHKTPHKEIVFQKKFAKMKLRKNIFIANQSAQTGWIKKKIT